MSIGISRRWLLGGAGFAAMVALPAAAQVPEVEPISALNAGLLQVMKEGKPVPFARRYAELLPIVRATFDLARMDQLAIGFYWDTLPAAQRQRLASLFEAYTVASYVSNFDSYSGEAFVISPQTRAVGAERVVKTTIVHTDGDRDRIDYVMALVGGQWKVEDVLLDGTISQLAVQRSEFFDLVAPGDASQLIGKLASKISDLSGGSVNG